MEFYLYRYLQPTIGFVFACYARPMFLLISHLSEQQLFGVIS